MMSQSSPEHEQDEAGNIPASGPVPDDTGPAFLVLGRIQRPHGVRGEMRLQIVTDYPERIASLERVYIGTDPYNLDEAIEFGVEATRRHRGQLLIKLSGIAHRDEAEQYRQQLLMVALEDAVPLEAGEYYVFEVLGAQAVTVEGQILGRVSDVLETGANDVFVVNGGPLGEILIPDIPDVVPEIDLENNQIIVDPPPGLLPD